MIKLGRFKQAQHWEKDVIDVCRMDGPRGCLNQAPGGEGIGYKRGQDVYLYVVFHQIPRQTTKTSTSDWILNFPYAGERKRWR